MSMPPLSVAATRVLFSLFTLTLITSVARSEPAAVSSSTEAATPATSTSSAKPTQLPVSIDDDGGARSLDAAPIQIRSMGTGFNGKVNGISMAPNGGLYVAGEFTSFDGLPLPGVARLDVNGVLDSSFAESVRRELADAHFTAAAGVPGGGLVVTGQFHLTKDKAPGGILYLRDDGRVDRSFWDSANQGFEGSATAVAAQRDGKIVVGGFFNKMASQAAPGLARLLPDGSFDKSFGSKIAMGLPARSSVNSILIQPDGKIVVVGDFRLFNNQKVDGIVRLNSDGSTDEEFMKHVRIGYFIGFDLNSADEEEESGLALGKAVLQSDGKIVVAGEFVFFGDDNGTLQSRLLRLDNTGQIDRSFMRNVSAARFSHDVNSVSQEADGKLVVGCDKPFARLNADGTLDIEFHRLASFGFRGQLQAFAFQRNDRIVVGGEFTSYKGIKVGNIVRINPDGTMDERFLCSVAHE